MAGPCPGPAFRRELPSRGLAVGDYDDDGRLDVLVATNGAAPVLLHNEAKAGGWVGVRLQRTTANRDAIGARVAWSGVGRRLRTERPSPRAMRRAIHEVLSQPHYRAASRRLAEEMAAAPGFARVADMADRLTQ